MHAPTFSAALEPIDPRLLLLAYRQGVFPMADARDDAEVFWVEPRERAIIPLDGFRCSRSLAKVLARGSFRVTCDAAFPEVIAECAAPRPAADGGLEGSWISHRIEASYIALQRRGQAHSIECWQEDRLVGGLYGVAFDRVFCGESMFSRADNASKVALAWLVAGMKAAGYRLLDCQFMTAHLGRMGAVPIPQARYLELIDAAAGPPEARLPLMIADLAARGDQASSPGKLIAQSLTQTS